MKQSSSFPSCRIRHSLANSRVLSQRGSPPDPESVDQGQGSIDRDSRTSQCLFLSRSKSPHCGWLNLAKFASQLANGVAPVTPHLSCCISKLFRQISLKTKFTVHDCLICMHQNFKDLLPRFLVRVIPYIGAFGKNSAKAQNLLQQSCYMSQHRRDPHAVFATSASDSVTAPLSLQNIGISHRSRWPVRSLNGAGLQGQGYRDRDSRVCS